jgi:hypothetical protein
MLFTIRSDNWIEQRGKLHSILISLSRSRARIHGQIIGETNPGKPVLYPSVVSWCHRGRLIEAANGDINLFSIRPCHKCQWRAAMWAE